MMDGDVASVIEQDKVSFPECRYTTSSSQRWSSINGDMTNEIIKRIQRHCPNKAPVEIYNQREHSSGESVKSVPHNMDEGRLIDPFSFFQNILGDFLPPPASHIPHPRTHERPPHKHSYDLNEFEPQTKPKSPGVISGPIEKI